ncbi:PepSY domain-containing protein [Tannerella sp.]|uniref:PepSY domain-containing protein n=1 Tax=Tannerella sp. TaxID=2382127 RepID=UPI003FA2E017
MRFFTKYHKWIGLFFTFFVLMFAISGVFLNHRRAITTWDVARSWLPKQYSYNNWNNGAISGTLPLSGGRVLMYGGSGAWMTDTLGRSPQPLIEGIRRGADNRNLRAVTQTAGGELFAVSPFCLYRLKENTNRWEEQSVTTAHEAFTDVQVKDDTLFVVSRSHIYAAAPPYTTFERIQLQQPENYTSKVSLFRTFWLLHSGELFGTTGKTVVDTIGVLLIVLCFTGLIITLFKIPIKRRKKKGVNSPKLKQTWTFSLKWHAKLGYLFFILLLIITVTGMFLRPPLLIPIARAQVKPLPGSTLESDNPWHDKLRRLRYDDRQQGWLLSSGDGFYALPSLRSVPQKLTNTPPVSVMGVTVWQKNGADEWLIGSFSGLYRWNISEQAVYDYLTGEAVAPRRSSGRPSFKNAVSGFSSDFSQGEVWFEYAKGACMKEEVAFVPMPDALVDARMSFWNVCLELHVGRLYYSFLRSLTDWYIFFAGLLMLFLVVSGYIVYRKRYRKKRTPPKKPTAA